MFACTATNCACALASMGWFGFSESPGPVRKPSQPAETAASESTKPALIYRFMSVLSRSMVEGDGDDPSPGQRVVEPVDAAVRRRSTSQVGLRVEAAVVGPERQVATRQLHVDLPQPSEPAEPFVGERVPDRHLAQTRVGGVFDAVRGGSRDAAQAGE